VNNGLSVSTASLGSVNYAGIETVNLACIVCAIAAPVVADADAGVITVIDGELADQALVNEVPAPIGDDEFFDWMLANVAPLWADEQPMDDVVDRVGDALVKPSDEDDLRWLEEDEGFAFSLRQKQ
jgi:hypothetical protein